MYAGISNRVIDEQSEIRPISPYGISKASAHYPASCYGKADDLRVFNAILFNHESELRIDKFSSRKAIIGIVNLYLHQRKIIKMDISDFNRDWSYTADVLRHWTISPS